MDEQEQLIHAYHTEAEALQNAWKVIDMEQFDQACDLLLHAERIAASGCGSSGFACMHFVHLMCCIERPARYIYPSEGMHGAMGFLHGGDVMLLCSRSGHTAEILGLLEVCLEKGVHVIAVTEDTSSPLGRRADVVLKLLVTREVDKFNIQGTTSFAVTNVLFDALQNALIDRVGFTTAQYALDHPGGALGESLQQLRLQHDPCD